jgi:RNA polymerase sigma factor (TIGR02999 family)
VNAKLRQIHFEFHVQDPTEITVLLRRWHAGDSGALTTLLPQVYAELRQLAALELRGQNGHTLQPTALLHEVFARLLSAEKVDIQNRKHLYTTAAKLMRQTLIDHERGKQRDKRGGSWQRADFVEALALPIETDTNLADLDEALSALALLDPRMAQIVELRYFVGIEVTEVGRLLDIDERTVYRDWSMARAWLKQRMAA